jgi:hypothetical protein
MSGKVGSADFGALYVDGYDLLASKLQGFTHKVASGMTPTHGLGDKTSAKSPTGVSTLTITQSGGFFDDSQNGAHVLLAPVANLQVSRLLAAAFAGNAIGKEFLGASGVYGMTYEVLGQIPQLTKANVGYEVAGTLDRGVILNQAVSKVASWNTKTDGFSVDYALDPSQPTIPIVSNTLANPTVITTALPHGRTTGDLILITGNITSSPSINGPTTYAVTVLSPTTFSIPVNCTTGGTGGSFVRANSANGGAGIQMIPALAGFTGFVGKIRDSPDDITYGDLLTFTNVTAAPAAERLTNVADTVVDRYLCYTGTPTGAGSVTAFVGFARA